MSDVIVLGNRGGNTTHECTDCGRWAYEGSAIVHSSRCDHREAQAVGVKVTRSRLYKATKEGYARAIYSDDEIVDAVRTGEISVSDAMNQDM